MSLEAIDPHIQQSRLVVMDFAKGSESKGSSDLISSALCNLWKARPKLFAIAFIALRRRSM